MAGERVCCVSCLLDPNRIDQFDLCRVVFKAHHMGDLLAPCPKLESVLASIDSSTRSELRKCVFDLYVRGFVDIPLLHPHYHFPATFRICFNGEERDIRRGSVYIVLEETHRSNSSLEFARYICTNFRNQTSPKPKFMVMRTPQDRLAYVLQCHQKEPIRLPGKYTQTIPMVWSKRERFVRNCVMEEALNQMKLNRERLSLIFIDDVVRIGLNLNDKGDLKSVLRDWLGRLRSVFGTLESVAVIIILDMWKYGVDIDKVEEAVTGIPEPWSLFKFEKTYYYYSK